MIAVIDYGTGNLRSVENALKRLGAEYILTADEAAVRSASHVILPGVGEASAAMQALGRTGLDGTIPTLLQPVLGICIGMQLMCNRSEEGNATCMGIFDTDVTRLKPSGGIKVPHMGWNTMENLNVPLFDGLRGGEYVYYVHSYAPAVCRDTIAVTEYGQKFSAALGCGNFYGTQFHPEKSGAVGEQILANFLGLR